MSVKIKSGDKVEFVAGNGKNYTGSFIRKFCPAKNAGAHFQIDIGHGVVGKSVKKVNA